ncbi:hypothetical protein OPV22_007022 [Ensete ventricosum]|uniref:Suppressor of forked domain-containing protein n=2 Tax=Ensete ventricosum TaxID=4639 RepID=A0AAV8RM14_ENSVE|nr:hypothetical protein OPV22_007022 [Ensete ventricosum]
MKPNLSSLTSTFPPPNSFPGAPYFSLKRHAVAPRRAPRVHICGSCSGRPSESPRIGDPEPPWLLHPPGAAPKHTSSGDAPLVGFRIKGSAVGIPFSLRLVQMKKKRMNSRLARAPPDTDVGDFGSAVWSLAFAMEEIQRSVLSSDYDGETRAGAPKDAADSVVWLFQNVFCTSPDLVVRLLVLLSEFLAASSKREMPDAIVFDEVEAAAYRCWFDVGILDEDEEATRYDGSRPDYKRRRAAYENMIASGLTTSLILSNYAQLLYQYEEDLDRAEYFFRWAVMQEPADAEAMNRYAFFLWRGRGDLEASEEMFLESLQADPESQHHGGSYALFLWSTGGLGTCYPLGDGGDADGEEL